MTIFDRINSHPNASDLWFVLNQHFPAKLVGASGVREWEESCFGCDHPGDGDYVQVDDCTALLLAEQQL